MSGGTVSTTGLIRRVDECMGTVFSFAVRDECGAAAVQDAIGWLHWVDRTFSTYRGDSAISRLNSGALFLADCPLEVGEVLAACAEVSRVSGGYFAASVNGALDPSGLVKGWAIERASDLLRAAGVADHAIGGGGDVQLRGESSPGQPWQIGIAHPARSGELLAVVEGRDLAVATSGTAERGAHVVNPLTGRPATDLLSITLVGERLGEIDAYATAALAMGAGAREWVEQLPGIEALGVTSDGSVWETSGFADHARRQAP